MWKIPSRLTLSGPNMHAQPRANRAPSRTYYSGKNLAVPISHTITMGYR